jgi:hypothetical protein
MGSAPVPHKGLVETLEHMHAIGLHTTCPRGGKPILESDSLCVCSVVTHVTLHTTSQEAGSAQNPGWSSLGKEANRAAGRANHFSKTQTIFLKNWVRVKSLCPSDHIFSRIWAFPLLAHKNHRPDI